MGTSAISGGNGVSLARQAPPQQTRDTTTPPPVEGTTPSQIRTNETSPVPENPLLTAQNTAYKGFIDFYNKQKEVDPLAFTRGDNNKPTAVKFAYRNNSDGDRTELGTA